MKFSSRGQTFGCMFENMSKHIKNLIQIARLKTDEDYNNHLCGWYNDTVLN